MNKTYRLIWSASANAFVAVSEITRAGGKRASAKVGSGFGWLILACLPTLLWAGAVPDTVVPVGGSPAYLAPNGVPVVDIAKANGQGLSHNTYSRFDIDNRGVVLNNISTARGNTQSQLAGMLMPNLSLGNEAKVILNEVTSARRSVLAGFAEVAGGRADVIVANQYGITCNGCGFINTDRVTLSTGAPVFNAQGGLEGFRVSRGDILAIGQGINGSAQQILDLVARSVKLEGQINADTLAVTTGANSWGYASRAVTGKVAGEGDVPLYALDTSRLGGMYANTIRLIATEAGVGVRMQGDAAAREGDFVLTAQGAIELNSALSAGRNLALSSGGATVTIADAQQNKAALTAKNDVTIDSGAGALSVEGASLNAGAALTVNAGALTDSGSANQRFAGTTLNLAIGGHAAITGNVWGAGNALKIVADGMALSHASLYSGSNGSGQLSLQTGLRDIVLDSSSIKANGALTLQSAAAIAQSGNGVLQARDDASLGFVTGLTLGKDGKVSSGGNLALHGAAGSTITQAGSLEAGQRLSIDAASGTVDMVHSGSSVAGDLMLQSLGTLQNSGRLQADTSMVIAAAAVSNGKDAVMLGKGTGSLLGFNVASLDNSGIIQSGGALSIESTGTLTNHTDGTLLTQGGDLTLTAAAVTNKGEIDSHAALGITSRNGDIVNANLMQSAGPVRLVSAGAISNGSDALLLGDATVALTAAGQLANDGQLQGGEGVSLTAAGLTNSGKVISGDAGHPAATLQIDTAQGAMSNTGVLQANASLSAKGGALLNQGKLLAGNNLVLAVASLDNQQTLQAGKDVRMTTAGALNNSGTMLAGHDMALASGSVLNTDTASLRALNQMTLQATSLDNRGVMKTATTLGINVTGAVHNSAEASVVSGGDTSLSAASLDNQGQWLAGGALTLLGSGAFTNGAAATMQSAGDLSVNAASFGNSGTLLADGVSTLTLQDALSNSGAAALIQSGKGLSVTAGSVLNEGAIQGLDTVSYTVGSLSNSGSLYAGKAFNLTSRAALENRGSLFGDAGLTLSAGSVANLGSTALLQARGNVSLGSAGSLVNEGKLIAGGTLGLTAGTAVINAGIVQAAGNLDLAAGSFDNQASGQWLGKSATTLRVSGALNNAGWMQSGKAFSLTGQSVTNSGQLVGVDLLSLRATGGDIRQTGATSSLQSGKWLQLTASGSIANDGRMIGVQRLDATARNGSVSNSATGHIESGLDMFLAGFGGISNQGEIVSGAGMDLLSLNSAATFDNSGKIQAETRLDIGLGDARFASLSNHGAGQIKGTTLGINGGVVNNEGQDSDHKARIEARRSLTITADSLNNRGANAVILASSDDGNVADSTITLSGNLLNDGAIHGNGNLTVSGAAISNSGTSGLSSLSTLSLTATGGDLSNAGALYGGQRLSLRADGGAIINADSGTMDSDHLFDSHSRDFSNAGAVTVVDAIDITTTNSFRNVTTGADSLKKIETLTVVGEEHQTDSLWEEGTLYSGGDVDIHEDRVKVTESLNGAIPDKRAQIIATGANGRIGINYGASGSNIVALISAQTITLNGTGTFTNRDLALYSYEFTRQWVRSHDCWVSGFGSECSTRYWAKLDPNAPKARHPSDSDDAADYDNPGAGWSSMTRSKDDVLAKASLSDNKNARQKSAVSTLQRFGSGVYGTTVSFAGGMLVNEGSPYADASVANTAVNEVKGATVTAKTVGASASSITRADRQNTLDGVTFGGNVASVSKKQVTPDSPVFISETSRSKAKVNPAGAVDLAGVNLTLPTNPNGYFVPSKNSGGNYLVESNPLFTQSGRYVGSDYLVERLGGNPEVTQKRLGDASYEAYLVRQQLIAQTQNNVLKGYGDEASQIKRLYDQAANQSGKLGLQWGVALSDAQKKSLTQDIVWMEDQVVNGQHVLVPVVYLAEVTRNSIDKGAVIAANDLKVEGEGLRNTGGTLVGANTLDVKVKGDIVNTSGTIKGGDVRLASTGGSVINKTLAVTRGDALSMDTEIGKTAGIQSTGKLAIDAAKAITVVGADVKGKDVSLSAGGNVTFDTIVDKKARSSASVEKGLFGASVEKSTTTTATHTGSNLSADGKLSIRSKGDTTLAGSAVKAGSMEVDAGGNFNVLARQDTKETKTSSSKSGLGVGGGIYGSTTTTTNTFDGKNKGSTINVAGNVVAKAGNEMVVQGSDVTVGGNASLKAKDIKVLDGLDEHRESSRTETTTFGKFGGSSDSNADANLKAAKASADAKAEGTLTLAETTVTEHSKGSTRSVASRLDVGGNLTMDADKSITVQGSQIAAGGDVDMKASDIAVLAGRNTDFEKGSSSTKSIGLYVDAGASADAASGGTHAEVGAGVKMQQSNAEYSKGSSTSVSSSIKAGGNLTRTASGTITDQAALVEAGGNINQSAKEIKALAAQDSRWDSSSSSSHTLKVGVSAEANAGKGGAEAMAGGRAQYNGEMADSQNSASTARVTQYKAGGNLNSSSSGKTTLEGAKLSAKGDVNIDAGSLDVTAARDEQHSRSSSTSINADLKVGVNQSGAPTGSLDAGLNAGADSSDASQAKKATIDGANITIRTKGDARFEGTDLNAANNVKVDAGGSVDFAAAHDTLSSSSKNLSVDLSVSATKGSKGADGKAGKTKKEGTLSVGAGSDSRSSSTAVTGDISAGKGGIEVHSGGKTTLEGTALDSGGRVTVKGDKGTELKEAVSETHSTSMALKGSVSKKSGDDKGDGKGDAAKPKAPAKSSAQSKASTAKGDGSKKEDDKDKGKKSVSGSYKNDTQTQTRKVDIKADGPVEIGK